MSSYAFSNDFYERPSALTPAELAVLAEIATGKSNKQIAFRRSTSPSTVQTQVHFILEKLALPNRAAAAVYAFQHGLINSADRG